MPADPAQDGFPLHPRLIFMGTPEFAVPCLKALIHHGHHVAAVVTQPDRPKGRGRIPAASPIKELATTCRIEVLQPELISDDRFCSRIRALEPDLFIVVAFGRLLKGPLLSIPKWGAVNIHASLLPEYRGAAPIQWAILNDDRRTGLTVMRMDEGMDTGPILLQEEIPILKDETAGELHDRLAAIAGDTIVRFLHRMIERPLKERPQEHARATYTGKIDRGFSLIRWDREAAKVSAHIRALDPRPGAYTTLQGKEIKLFASRVENEDRLDVVPGRVVKGKEGALYVEAGEGLVEIGEVQYSGKKRLSASDFLRGFSLPAGTLFGG